MRRHILALSALMLTGAPLVPAVATPAPLPAPPSGATLPSGVVAGIPIGPTTTVVVAGDSEPRGKTSGGLAIRCPEVNDPPEYTLSSTPYHIPDARNPMSTWLEPGQSVDWTMTNTHAFTFDVKVGAESEAGVIIAKAKVKIDAGITNTWTSSVGHRVTDTNNTRKSYRAVLGNKGYRITWTKSRFVSPCRQVKTSGSIVVPKKGDLSIGRYPR